MTAQPLEGAEYLELATPPPKNSSLLDRLFSVASAEEGDGLEGLLGELEAEEGVEEDIPEDQRVTITKDDLALNTNLPEGVYNVLLMATDSRDVNANTGRSDVMIIASLDMTANEIKLVSLSRDLWVPIANTSRSNKLNAAYAYGGPLLALKTVNQLFEMNMQDYIVVNFATMSEIVDALGGVDIQLMGEEYKYINENVAVSEDYEGFAKSDARRVLTEAERDTVVHLDGLQAVSYARIRKMDDDLQRGSRQRILLQAMMDKAMQNLSLSTFYSLATSMMNSTSTNMKLTQVMDIGTWILSADSFPTLGELSIPVPGSFRSDMEDGLSVVKFAQAQNVEALHTFLFGEYIPAVTP